ncbi:MAG TPA: winged helix-turn-helix domain-containing protein [Gaiellaceae bacterium]|jgi:DNA-binding IclR family transcriptional regulator|nr:winged helix-turn-helix domain-containing protein [Gaiellaceae bacterium]
MSSDSEAKTWTFLTNHAQVLLCLAETPDIRLRDVAERVGITERATQRILAELVEAGYVKSERVGRRNRYTVDRQHAMRHSAQFGYEIGALLEALS